MTDPFWKGCVATVALISQRLCESTLTAQRRILGITMAIWGDILPATQKLAGSASEQDNCDAQGLNH